MISRLTTMTESSRRAHPQSLNKLTERIIRKNNTRIMESSRRSEDLEDPNYKLGRTSRLDLPASTGK